MPSLWKSFCKIPGAEMMRLSLCIQKKQLVNEEEFAAAEDALYQLAYIELITTVFTHFI